MLLNPTFVVGTSVANKLYGKKPSQASKVETREQDKGCEEQP
jgi:hypothetical protein